MRPSHYNSRTRAELTERQRDVLGLIAKGKTNPQIADALGMTLDGAKFHVSEILTKLDVSTREEAAAWWREERSAKKRVARGMGWLSGGWRWLAVGGSALAVAAIGGGLAAWMLMDSGSASHPDEDLVFQLTPPGGMPEIVTYSPTAHAIVHRFPEPMDASGDAWAPAASAGNHVAFVSKDFRVMVQDLDGSNERVIYRSGSQYAIPAVEASPDGRYFAILDNPGKDAVPIITVVDPSTGQQLVRVEQPLLEGGTNLGAPYLLMWHTDSRGLTVKEFTNNPGSSNGASNAAFANVGLDGSVRITQGDSDDMISPDGRFIAYADAFDPKCGDLGSESAIHIADLATGKTVADIDDAQGRLRLWRWGADSSAAAYQVYDAPACSPHQDTAAWWALPVDGGSPHRISGGNALEGSGRGPLVQVDCGYPWIDTLTQPSYGPVSHYGGDCLSSFTRDTAQPVPSKYNNVGHMLIDRRLAFLFDSFQFVGFAKPSTSKTSVTPDLLPATPTPANPDALAGATCSDLVFQAVCEYARQLAGELANPGVIAELVKSGALTTYICAENGTTTTSEFTDICAGHAPGSAVQGFHLAMHGSEGQTLLPGAFEQALDEQFASKPQLASVGCGVSALTCQNFVVAFATGTQPSVVYLAFDRAPDTAPVLVAAGLSGDNAETIANGGTTQTAIGLTHFVALPP